MGLLSRNTQSIHKINTEYLEETGFYQIPWGSPDGRDKHGRCKWNKEHTCWEYYKDVDGYYKIIIYYFPEGFTSYVTPFSYNGEDPAGNVLCAIENGPGDEVFLLKQAAEYIGDIDAVITIAEKEVVKLNKRFGIEI
jgi:hypothetical protein